MGPQPYLRWRHSLQDGIDPSPGAPRRRHRAALLAGLLALSIIGPSGGVDAAPARPAVAPLATVDAAASHDWIVTLKPAAVSPDGVGISSRRYRLDTPTGRTAARGRAQLTERLIGRLEDRRGFRAGQRFGWAMQGFTAELTGSQVAALRADPSVASVVPDAPASIAADTVPLGIERINATAGTTPGVDVDVDVAVIDTGVGPVGGPVGAPELDIAGGTDCRPRRSGGYPDAGSYADGHGHGTHVAGTIAARANGVGVVGVAPGARIWAVRVFDSRGAGTTASVICGIEWVTRWLAEHPGSRMAVNMSLRGPDEYHGPHRCDADGHDARDPEHQTICTAVRAGALFAVAAGNESDDANGYIPARYDEVVTVGALSDFDGLPGGLSTRTRLSGCLPPTDVEHDDSYAAYSNFGSVVDVVAPGTCIRSLVPGTGSSVGTTFMSGTSMATPHVTGALARFLATHPGPAADAAGRLVASAALDWLTTTDPWQGDDPDAPPLRVVDVAALAADAPGLRAWTRRSVLSVPGGAGQRTVRVELQRLGDLTDPVELSIPDLPAGIQVAGGDSTGIAGVRGSLVLSVGASVPDGDHPLRIHADTGSASADADLIVRVDREPPDVTSSRPRVTLGKGKAFDGTATVHVSWAATDTGSGVARTDLQRSKGGSWTRVARAGGSGTANVPLGKGSSARFRIVARDRAGNTSTSPVVSTRLVVRDSSTGRLSWTGTWQTRHVMSASGQSVRTARDPGAQATLRFTGRAVAVVAPRGPGKGRMDITIDGTKVATVDLATSKLQPRRVVFASSALTPGDHVIQVRSRRAGTELDAILVLE